MLTLSSSTTASAASTTTRPSARRPQTGEDEREASPRRRHWALALPDGPPVVIAIGEHRIGSRDGPRARELAPEVLVTPHKATVTTGVKDKPPNTVVGDGHHGARTRAQGHPGPELPKLA
jgi:hypothetical protein